jgi:hypothetical protein
MSAYAPDEKRLMAKVLQFIYRFSFYKNDTAFPFF